MQYLSHTKYKAKMQQIFVYSVLRNKALPAQLKLRVRSSAVVQQDGQCLLALGCRFQSLVQELLMPWGG